ncbi:MAG TPA: EAL domain-containing protein [Thermoanaerobaculia bacterium]|nr:EAL domain-containing protein [Thermoanaerobaculia bacterium]
MIRTAALTHPLETVFQPIFETENDGLVLHAVECLTRGPHGSTLEQAPMLFDYVRRRHLEPEVDRLCIAQALREAGNGGTHRIAVNIHPVTLADRRDFASFLIRESAAAGIDSDRLIVEIGEQRPASDASAFRRTVCALRDHGIHIAIDDVGSDHANYRTILDCRPEYLKIDRYFIDGVSEDRARQAVVRSICDLGSFFDAQIVAEGVERAEDDEALLAMGIRLFQGFLYARPASNVDRASARSGRAVARPTLARAWLNGWFPQATR